MNKGLRMVGLAPSASTVKPLVAEAGIESEILYSGSWRVAPVSPHGPLTNRGARRYDGADEGLTLIHRDPDTHRRLVRPVLLAGPTHDADRYVEEAFNLSNDSQVADR